MPAPSRLCLLLSVMFAITWQNGRAQTYTCLPDTAEQAQVLHDYIVSVVTGTDSETIALRNLYHLPAVDASKVTVVTTASVCKQAGAAYHTAVTTAGTPAVSRTLVVVKVSTTRYIVLDPNQHAGEFAIHVVFDNKWKDLGGFGA